MSSTTCLAELLTLVIVASYSGIAVAADPKPGGIDPSAYSGVPIHVHARCKLSRASEVFHVQNWEWLHVHTTGTPL